MPDDKAASGRVGALCAVPTSDDLLCGRRRVDGLRKGPKRTTIVDVSRLAGVSIKTVSRVFNDEPHVSDKARAQVRAAAKTLNYHPNMLARALVRRRSHLIGLVYEKPSASYVAELQRGVLGALQDTRYRLVVMPVESVVAHAARMVELLRSAGLDGVVLAPPAADSEIILSDLASAGLQCARIAPTRALDAAPVVLLDDVAAAREIAEHVIALGHREIAIIKGDPTHASADARMAGYEQAFAAAGLAQPPEHRVAQGVFTRDSGYRAARQLLDRTERPTAILAQNDDMAIGTLIAARELGLEVPGDLTIVGFDDSEVAQVSWPRITTIRQPVAEMAASAATMVLAQLGGEAFEPRRSFAHELIVRESSGPPRSGP